MSAIEAPPRVTLDEYLAMADRDRYELVHGQLEEACVSNQSSWTGGRIYGRLDASAEATGLGFAFPADEILRLWPDEPDHTRRADAAFIRKDRLPGGRFPFGGVLEIAPDIVAEVISPHEDADDVETKIREYFAAGVRLVWVAYPSTRTVHIYRPDGSAAVLDERGTISGEDVLPGLEIPVASIFPPADDA